MRGTYDVLIVGGRSAGASLAARLGERGLATLVIDRARFPSPPAVPSCAMLHPAAMALVDELGVDQREFGDDTALIRRLVIDVAGRYDTAMDTFESHGRDYIYGIDRARFDRALWRNLARHMSVTTRDNTAFLDVLRDGDGAVIGARIKTEDGATRAIRARCVIGADGRFSPVARKVGAHIREEFPHTSTVHFATWEGVLPYDDDDRATVHIYTTARGLNVLFFPTPERRMYVCIHARSDRVQIEGSVQDYYLRTVQSLPDVRRRLAAATQIDAVVGLKRVANRYRQAGGPGWMLAGDALHHKDPIDGQGIYDALIGTKFLARELASWLAGQRSFADALAAYDRQVMDETHPMFEATTQRIARELYSEPPQAVIRTVMRWVLTDPTYRRRYMQYLFRAVPPSALMKRSLTAGAIARGVLRDLRRLLPRPLSPPRAASRG